MALNPWVIAGIASCGQAAGPPCPGEPTVLPGLSCPGPLKTGERQTFAPIRIKLALPNTVPGAMVYVMPPIVIEPDTVAVAAVYAVTVPHTSGVTPVFTVTVIGAITCPIGLSEAFKQ